MLAVSTARSRLAYLRVCLLNRKEKGVMEELFRRPNGPSSARATPVCHAICSRWLNGTSLVPGV